MGILLEKMEENEKRDKALFPKRLLIFLLVILAIGGPGVYFAETHRNEVLKETVQIFGKVIEKGWHGRKVNRLRIEYYFNGKKYSRYIPNEFDIWNDIDVGDCFEMNVAKQDPSIFVINFKRGKVKC